VKGIDLMKQNDDIEEINFNGIRYGRLSLETLLGMSLLECREYEFLEIRYRVTKAEYIEMIEDLSGHDFWAEGDEVTELTCKDCGFRIVYESDYCVSNNGIDLIYDTSIGNTFYAHNLLTCEEFSVEDVLE
jgi:hypothetical protein